VLKIAFIGFNAKQTHGALLQLAVDNADQVKRYDRRQGSIVLRDGTEIMAVPPGDPVALHGRRFDQIIIADDWRLMIMEHLRAELRALDRCCQHSIVPEEFRYQIYDMDAEEPKK
jgi:hypothetical protein